MSKKKSGRRVWRGVTTATASLLALSVCASTVVDGFRTDIDKFLGTKSTKLVTEDSDGTDLYTFKSDYTSTTELLHGIQDVGERMSEEGSVLLKNNGALPLTKDETQKITLLGFSSYYPVQGGDMGSSLVENTGTDADTVDMVGAFKAKGFGLNQTVADMYEALQPTFKSEVQSWGGTIEYNHITAPSTTGVFSSKEPSQAALDGQNATWKDSMNDNNVMIVTIARSASENGTYQPGTAGVDPTQNLNQTDPLGLSDDERDLINAAVTAKAANGGKVIVLLNNASAMEVQEIEDNVGVDAILQVGLPGGYGFYGVADILSGAVSPSGHLTDTYAVKNANSPAAQNFGDLQWTNTNPDINMNDAVVEAENIYIGYKYYETRYFDTVMGQGNAASTVGSSTGSAWNYDDEVTYPFGYGLSYTTFEQTLDNLNVDLENETVTANVTVKNTGSVAGKDVVQLYVSLPYTDYDKEHGVEKAAIQLLDYGKTAELAPGASETVTITADMQNMASWDSTADNAAGTKGCYILDAGDYYFTAATDAHNAVNNILAAKGYTVESTNGKMTADGNADLTYTWTEDALDTTTYATSENGTAITNQLSSADPNLYEGIEDTVTWLSRSDWNGTLPTETVKLALTDLLKKDLKDIRYDPADYESVDMPTLGAKNGVKLYDMIGLDYNDPKWDELLDQMTFDEMNSLIGDAFHWTMPVKSVEAPGTRDENGPQGLTASLLGNDKSQLTATAFTSEDVMAATFNTEIMTEIGKVIGNNCLEADIACLYGPGNNIHRTPYGGRNFEYYSEDGFLSGMMSAYEVKAIQDKGVHVVMKHFALNDCEQDRIGLGVWLNEQAAREVYLKAFQAPVEVGNANGVMIAYTRWGAVWSGGNYGLVTGILRNEWGCDGMVITDNVLTQYVNGPDGVLAGVSIYDAMMSFVTDTLPKYKNDPVIVTAMREACHHNLYAIANSCGMNGVGADTTIKVTRPTVVTMSIIIACASTFFCLLGIVMWIIGGIKFRKTEEYKAYKDFKKSLKAAKKA